MPPVRAVLMDSSNTAAHAKSVGAVDGTDKNHVAMMIEDMENGLNRKLESIKTDMLMCKQDQYNAYCTAMIKIPKGIRQMTIKDFNQKYNCNLLELLQTAKTNALEEAEILQEDPVAINPIAEAPIIPEAPVALCGKRDRFETPALNRGNRPMETPATVRTVRRGEMLYSRNGSPVDPMDEGALVATVAKKRRADEPPATNFDISIGEGRFISLNDPNGVKKMDPHMKSNALTQLKVLQDQMASLMAQLTTSESK